MSEPRMIYTAGKDAGIRDCVIQALVHVASYPIDDPRREGAWSAYKALRKYADAWREESST